MLGPRRLLIALALTCATLAPSGQPADAAAPGGRVERYTVRVLQEMKGA